MGASRSNLRAFLPGHARPEHCLQISRFVMRELCLYMGSNGMCLHIVYCEGPQDFRGSPLSDAGMIRDMAMHSLSCSLWPSTVYMHALDGVGHVPLLARAGWVWGDVSGSIVRGIERPCGVDDGVSCTIAVLCIEKMLLDCAASLVSDGCSWIESRIAVSKMLAYLCCQVFQQNECLTHVILCSPSYGSFLRATDQWSGCSDEVSDCMISLRDFNGHLDCMGMDYTHKACCVRLPGDMGCCGEHIFTHLSRS